VRGLRELGPIPCKSEGDDTLKGSVPRDIPYKEVPPEKGTFFRLQVYKRGDIQKGKGMEQI